MTEATINSILAVECGTVSTSAALIEMVDDEFRLTATGETGSTYDSPWQDITIGVVAAVRQIEKATNRILLAPGGWPFTPQSNKRQGVDAFVIVSSAGKPLQMTLIGLMQDISLASAHRAAATTYTATGNVISLDAALDSLSGGASTNGAHSAETRIQTLQQGQHDVILLVGGTDGGAERPVIEMANILSMAMRVLPEADRPVIIYAGNSHVREQVSDILDWTGTFKTVDNVCPVLDRENPVPIQTELESLYFQQKMFPLPGFEKLSNWSRYSVLPAGKSFKKLIAYLGQHHNLNVIGVNLGSGSTVVSTQVGDQHSTLIRSDAGIGHSLAALLRAVPIDKFHRWLPWSITPAELHNYLLNKSLHPTTLPVTYEDLMIEYAVAREAIRLVRDQIQARWSSQPAIGQQFGQWNLVVAAGRILTRAPHPAHVAMVLLDAVEPWGITSLALDISSTANMLGAIAAVQPVAAVQLAIRDSFLNLGTVIAPKGHGIYGQTALKIKVRLQNDEFDISPEAEENDFSEEIDIPYGSIKVLPLPSGQKATVEMRPTRYFDIGLGQPGRGAVADVEGGILGIIIDARGRPLRLPARDEQRHELLGQWLSNLDITYAASGNNY